MDITLLSLIRAPGRIADDSGMTTTRLSKHIAETGCCSRREADRLISSRRVTVNGSVAGVARKRGQVDFPIDITLLSLIRVSMDA